MSRKVTEPYISPNSSYYIVKQYDQMAAEVAAVIVRFKSLDKLTGREQTMLYKFIKDSVLAQMNHVRKTTIEGVVDMQLKSIKVACDVTLDPRYAAAVSIRNALKDNVPKRGFIIDRGKK